MNINDELQDRIAELAEKYYDEGQNRMSDFIDAMTELLNELPNDNHEAEEPKEKR